MPKGGAWKNVHVMAPIGDGCILESTWESMTSAFEWGPLLHGGDISSQNSRHHAFSLLLLPSPLSPFLLPPVERRTHVALAWDTKHTMNDNSDYYSSADEAGSAPAPRSKASARKPSVPRPPRPKVFSCSHCQRCFDRPSLLAQVCPSLHMLRLGPCVLIIRFPRGFPDKQHVLIHTGERRE